MQSVTRPPPLAASRTRHSRAGATRRTSRIASDCRRAPHPILCTPPRFTRRGGKRRGPVCKAHPVFGQRNAMPGETELHKTLKKEACRWLFKMGYRCIAAEVRLRPLGIIDAVGTGVFRPYHNYLAVPREVPQVCFVECKASRSDFLRDCSHDGQMQLCL